MALRMRWLFTVLFIGLLVVGCPHKGQLVESSKIPSLTEDEAFLVKALDVPKGQNVGRGTVEHTENGLNLLLLEGTKETPFTWVTLPPDDELDECTGLDGARGTVWLLSDTTPLALEMGEYPKVWKWLPDYLCMYGADLLSGLDPIEVTTLAPDDAQRQEIYAASDDEGQGGEHTTTVTLSGGAKVRLEILPTGLAVFDDGGTQISLHPCGGTLQSGAFAPEWWSGQADVHTVEGGPLYLEYACQMANEASTGALADASSEISLLWHDGALVKVQGVESFTWESSDEGASPELGGERITDFESYQLPGGVLVEAFTTTTDTMLPGMDAGVATAQGAPPVEDAVLLDPITTTRYAWQWTFLASSGKTLIIGDAMDEERN